MTTEQAPRFGLVSAAYDIFTTPLSDPSVLSCVISPDGRRSQSCVNAVVVSIHREGMVGNKGRLIEYVLMLALCKLKVCRHNADCFKLDI